MDDDDLCLRCQQGGGAPLKWRVYDTGVRSPEWNMEEDRKLLQQLEPETGPLLHLYDWEGLSITYGHFIDPEKNFNLQELQREKIRIARRPTGGGITVHWTDFAFSLLLPATHPGVTDNTLDNYFYVNSLVAEVVERWSGKKPELCADSPTRAGSFCMGGITIYDLILDGKKAGGAAQRKTRQGILHQGSLFLSMPDRDLVKRCLNRKDRLDEHNHWLLGENASAGELAAARSGLKKSFIQAGC